MKNAKYYRLKKVRDKTREYNLATREAERKCKEIEIRAKNAEMMKDAFISNRIKIEKEIIEDYNSKSFIVKILIELKEGFGWLCEKIFL